MAVKKIRRQPKLPGHEDFDKELEDAAEALAKARAAVTEAQEQNEDATNAMMEVMKRKSKKVYKTETLRPSFTITIENGGPKLKVKADKGGDGSDDTEEQKGGEA